MRGLSSTLSGEPDTEVLPTAEGLRGYSCATGLEESDMNETELPPGLKLQPPGAESSPPPPESDTSLFGSPLCSPSGFSCNQINTNINMKGTLKNRLPYRSENTVRNNYGSVFCSIFQPEEMSTCPKN